MFARTTWSLVASLSASTTAAVVALWFDRQVLYVLSIVIVTICIWHRNVISTLWLRFMDKRHYSEDQMNPDDFSFKPRGVTQRCAIALYWTLTRIKRISPTEAPALVSFFALALLMLLIFRRDILEFDKDFFRSNIVPEIFGFLLDGLLILGVLGYWARRKAARESEALRKVLRNFLWRYATHAVVTLKLSDNPASLLGSQYASYRILNRFQFAWQQAEPSLQVDFLKSVANFVQVDADAAMALLPVAAMLNSDHAEVWLRLIYLLKKFKKSDSKVFIHNFIDLLGIIIELDDLNFLDEKPKLNFQQLMNLR